MGSNMPNGSKGKGSTTGKVISYDKVSYLSKYRLTSVLEQKEYKTLLLSLLFLFIFPISIFIESRKNTVTNRVCVNVKILILKLTSNLV